MFAWQVGRPIFPTTSDLPVLSMVSRIPAYGPFSVGGPLTIPSAKLSQNERAKPKKARISRDYQNKDHAQRAPLFPNEAGPTRLLNSCFT